MMEETPAPPIVVTAKKSGIKLSLLTKEGALAVCTPVSGTTSKKFISLSSDEEENKIAVVGGISRSNHKAGTRSWKEEDQLELTTENAAASLPNADDPSYGRVEQLQSNVLGFPSDPSCVDLQGQSSSEQISALMPGAGQLPQMLHSMPVGSQSQLWRPPQMLPPAHPSVYFPHGPPVSVQPYPPPVGGSALPPGSHMVPPGVNLPPPGMPTGAASAPGMHIIPLTGHVQGSPIGGAQCWPPPSAPFPVGPGGLPPPTHSHPPFPPVPLPRHPVAPPGRSAAEMEHMLAANQAVIEEMKMQMQDMMAAAHSSRKVHRIQ